MLRVPRVELVRAGRFDLSTGVHDFTAEQILGAVEAARCPAVRRPVLKLGHTDPRFDGEPALGWVENLTASTDGSLLLGDYAGMPDWLDGGVLASAYPSRSIEGLVDHLCQLGHTHPLVVTAVALLGATEPAIGSLADIRALYDVAASSGARVGRPVRIRITASKGTTRMPAPTAVTPAVAAAARQLGVDVATVHGTGTGGRITLADVRGAATTAARARVAAAADDGWFESPTSGAPPTVAAPASVYRGDGLPAFTASGIPPQALAGLPRAIRPVIAGLASPADAYALANDYRGMSEEQASAAVVRAPRGPVELAFAHYADGYVEPQAFGDQSG